MSRTAAGCIRIALALAVSVALSPLASNAQVHLCKDSRGRKTFSDVPCGPDAVVVNVNPAAGGPAINPNAQMHVEHYEIRGTTWEALRREIDSRGPAGWWGDASTGLVTDLKTRPVANGCAVDSVRTTVDSRVRLPLWVNRFEGSRDLQVYWDGVYRSLDLHERGHVRISLDGAREMERAINGVAPQATCGEVQAEAKRRSDAVNAAIAQRQSAYDKDTDHGRRQWSPYVDTRR